LADEANWGGAVVVAPYLLIVFVGLVWVLVGDAIRRWRGILAEQFDESRQRMMEKHRASLEKLAEADQPSPIRASAQEPLVLDGTNPINESAYCHHRHHLDEHSTDFDTCPHFICTNAREVARGRQQAEQERPLLGIVRIYELLDEFGITETDALKHRLEDYERWKRDVQHAEQLPRHHPELEAMDPRNVAFRLWQENDKLKAQIQKAEQTARMLCDGSYDIELARRQVGPDGDVPGNARECAHLWEREAHRLEMIRRDLVKRVQQAEQEKDWAEKQERLRYEAEAKVAVLTQALKDYGGHKPNCAALPMMVGQVMGKFPAGKCSCGLDAALTGAQITGGKE